MCTGNQYNTQHGVWILLMLLDVSAFDKKGAQNRCIILVPNIVLVYLGCSVKYIVSKILNLICNCKLIFIKKQTGNEKILKIKKGRNGEKVKKKQKRNANNH